MQQETCLQERTRGSRLTEEPARWGSASSGCQLQPGKTFLRERYSCNFLLLGNIFYIFFLSKIGGIFWKGKLGRSIKEPNLFWGKVNDDLWHMYSILGSKIGSVLLNLI